MTNLNNVNIGMNKYCGPAVLSILTAKSTDECAATISKITGNYKVTGVYIHDLLKAARLLNFENELVHQGGSLYMAIITLKKRKLTGKFIVSLTNHFVVIEIFEDKIYFCDNHTKEPMPASSSARLTQEVVQIHRVWELKPIQKPELVVMNIEVVAEYYDCGIKAVEYTTYTDLSQKSRILGNIPFNSLTARHQFMESVKDKLWNEPV